jgi:uncharacterized OB-fold protein
MLDEKKIQQTVTPLSEKDIRSGKYVTVPWSGDLRYAWDDGVAIGRYLAELKNGKIIARSCEGCRRIMLPPRMFCELCWRPSDEWVYVQDTGVINTVVISHVDWKATRVPEGERYFTPAVIEIDGASPGMGILHHIDEIEPYDVRIGMRVKAVWKSPRQRTGAITDIRYFKPLG